MKVKKIIKQTSVFLKKNMRIFINQKDWRFIIIAIIISFLVCSIVGKDMFDTYESTKSGFFAIISAAIWIGIFNSIQRICKEHKTIEGEYRGGMNMTAYVLSHVLFDFVICLSQAIALMVICIIYIEFPKEGIIFDSAIVEYFITFMLIIWCSDIMGIMISSIASNPNVAMTIMPFVLILQLVMSGVLFELSGWSEKVANLTYSKWGMSALGSIANLNSKELPLKLSKVFPEVVRLSEEKVYESTMENLLTGWGSIAFLGFSCIIISILVLKIRNRKV